MAQHKSSFKRERLRNFGGGLNTETFPTDIGSNELQICENMFIDDFGAIRTRTGLNNSTLTEMNSDINSITYNKYQNGTDGLTKANIFMRESGGRWYGVDDTYAGPVRADDGTTPITSNGTSMWSFVRFNSAPTGVVRGCLFGFPYDTDTTSNDPWVWASKAVDISNGVGKQKKLSALTTNFVHTRLATVFGKRIFTSGTGNPQIIFHFNPSVLAPWIMTPLGVPLNDSGPITGMVGFNKRLFIFKEDKILMMVPDANNPEDSSGWFFYVVSDKIGTRFPFSIKNIGNDVIFLSDYGLASLRAVQEFGDFQSAILSNKIYDLRDINIATYPNVHSEVDQSAGHYLLAVADNDKIYKVYGFDFKYYQVTKQPRWFQYSGKYLGSRLGQSIISGSFRIAVGGRLNGTTSSVFYPYLKSEQNSQTSFFKDKDESGIASPFIQKIRTKAFMQESESRMKRINKLGYHTLVLKDPGTNYTDLSYTIDDLASQTAHYTITTPGQPVAPDPSNQSNVTYFPWNIMRRAQNPATAIPKVYRNIYFTWLNAEGLAVQFKELWYDWQYANDRYADAHRYTEIVEPNSKTNPELSIPSYINEQSWSSAAGTNSLNFGPGATNPVNPIVASFGFPASTHTLTELGLFFMYNIVPSGTYGVDWSVAGTGADANLRLIVRISTDSGVTWNSTVFQAIYPTAPPGYPPFDPQTEALIDLSSYTITSSTLRVAFSLGGIDDVSRLTATAISTTAGLHVGGVKLIGSYYL